MKRLIFPMLLLSNLFGHAQQDTLRLSLEMTLEIATNYHPILRQSDLQDRLARAMVVSAKGALDPKLQTTYSEKNLKGTNYYNKLYNSLKVPVWFPIDPKVEVYQNQGTYLNPENFVSSQTDNWQVTAGVSLPIGKGLFIDERRSLIKQSKLFSSIAEADKIKLANKTILSIVKSYWNWSFAYEQYQLMLQSIDIARELFDRVKTDYTFGEASVVDTLQAKITYQNRLVDLQKASLELISARLALSVHLWNENNVPLELPEHVFPVQGDNLWQIPDDSAITQLQNWANENHPEIQKLVTKGEQMEIEQRWNRESLKPEINLSYSLIDAPINIDGFDSPEPLDNYKMGLDFSFPLFLRKERGQLQKTRIYMESIDFELQQTRQEVSAGIRTTYAELMINESLRGQYRELAENYRRIFEAELFNVENGESDLFKLNIQQDKYIESQIKFLQAQMKAAKLRAELPYATGLPYLSYEKVYE